MFGGPPLKVLVVDDNPDAAASLAGFLILAGHHPRFFTDGGAALAAAAAFAPDACVLDVRMPGADGFAVAAGVRAAVGDGVALFAVTGADGDDLDRRLAAAGFRARFPKPADPRALLDALTAAAARPATAGGGA